MTDPVSDPRTVLVIEDDPAVRDTIQDLLEARGFRVLLAETGEAGLETARTHAPDVILCDIVMSGLDGHAVLRALRSDSATAGIPFVFLTALSQHADQRRGMESGADDYVTKPFAPEELLRSLRAQIEKRDAARRRAHEELDQLRRGISGLLSHELLTPLTPILGYATMLRRAGEATEGGKLREMAEAIETGARGLERMVRNVLFYADLELLASDPGRPGSPPPAVTGSVAEPIRAAGRRAAARLGREADLRLEVEDGAAWIPESHLEKIVEELVDNACKFSAPGTPVHVHARRNGPELRIAVTDAGRGMTPAEVQRIGAYVQFDRARLEQQGAGLGLAIVKRAAELAGGRLALESAPRQGTVATVTLPA